jgi:hypothetical protein
LTNLAVADDYKPDRRIEGSNVYPFGKILIQVEQNYEIKEILSLKGNISLLTHRDNHFL